MRGRKPRPSGRSVVHLNHDNRRRFWYHLSMKNLVRIAVLAGFLSGCAYNPNTGTYYFPTAYGQGYRYVAPYSYAPYPVAPYYPPGYYPPAYPYYPPVTLGYGGWHGGYWHGGSPAYHGGGRVYHGGGAPAYRGGGWHR